MTANLIPPTEPITVLDARPPWRETFAALRVRNYRLYAGGQLIAVSAAGMQRIAQDWIVLQLSGHVADVGITVLFQFAPMLVFGLVGGIIADRYPKRRVLIVTQTGFTLCAAALAVLILTGTVQVWEIWGIACVGGFVTVVDNPARQAFVTEIVGPLYLRNAISLNSSTFQLGMLIGPAVGGVLLDAVGGGWSFAINAVGAAIAGVVLMMMDPSQLHPGPAVQRSRGQLREGLAYAKRKPAILNTLIVLGAVSTFAYTLPVLLTDFADKVFNVGAAGYGLFNAASALGALLGALLSTRRLSVRLRTTVAGAALLGAVQLAAGFAPDVAIFALLIACTGVTSLLFLTAANSLTQLSTNVAIRGRVMSLYILIQLGGQAIGGPIMGWIVQSSGAQVGMAVSGLVPLVVALVVGIVVAWRATGRARGILQFLPRPQHH